MSLKLTWHVKYKIVMLLYIKKFKKNVIQKNVKEMCNFFNSLITRKDLIWKLLS